MGKPPQTEGYLNLIAGKAAAPSINELTAERDRLKVLNAKLLTALGKIAEGRGRFSLNHLKHAKNCIEDMKALANAAVTNAEEV